MSVQNEERATGNIMPTIIKPTEIDQYQSHESEPTAWHTVTQDQVNQFADCTLDHQFIHVDPKKAKDSPFGTTIAHGFLTLSMLSYFALEFSVVLEGMQIGVNSGFDKVRFVSPVKVGSRIRAHARVVEIVERKPGQFRLLTKVSVEIEGETKPALVVDWIGVQIIG